MARTRARSEGGQEICAVAQPGDCTLSLRERAHAHVPRTARAHKIAIVIEQRGLIERAFLIRNRRHPIGAVGGKKLHPFPKAALVEEARFMNEELFEFAFRGAHASRM